MRYAWDTSGSRHAETREYLIARCGHSLPSTPSVTMCLTDTQQPYSPIVGGVMFANYTALHDVHLVVATDTVHMCRRSILSSIFEKVFMTLQCVRCTALVRADNARSLKLCKGLGFEVEGVMREAWPGTCEDTVVLGLLRHECRFWRCGNVRTFRQRSARAA